jgi:predicted metal-dependent hydrolase
MSIQIDKLVLTHRKTIALIVERDGRLIVRAPLELSEGSIREFVKENREWIEKNQKRAQKYTLPAPKQYKDGETFLFMGQPYPLTIVPHQRAALTFNKATFRLAKSAIPKAEKAFVRWYKAQAMLQLFQRVMELSEKYDFTYKKIRISSARTRWGSCSSKGSLSFTWRLVMAPPEVLDYVIIHELVHTEIKNHSKAFWVRLGEFMPEYMTNVRWLKQHGKYLFL